MRVFKNQIFHLVNLCQEAGFKIEELDPNSILIGYCMKLIEDEVGTQSG